MKRIFLFFFFTFNVASPDQPPSRSANAVVLVLAWLTLTAPLDGKNIHVSLTRRPGISSRLQCGNVPPLSLRAPSRHGRWLPRGAQALWWPAPPQYTVMMASQLLYIHYDNYQHVNKRKWGRLISLKSELGMLGSIHMMTLLESAFL